MAEVVRVHRIDGVHVQAACEEVFTFDEAAACPDSAEVTRGRFVYALAIASKVTIQLLSHPDLRGDRGCAGVALMGEPDDRENAVQRYTPRVDVSGAARCTRYLFSTGEGTE